MLHIQPDKVRLILEKIKSFKEAIGEFPPLTSEQDSTYTLSDPAYQEILRIINNLPLEQKASLVALMYLGNNDFKKSEWEDAFNTASKQLTQHIGEYLLCQTELVHNIENGLKILGFNAKYLNKVTLAS